MKKSIVGLLGLTAMAMASGADSRIVDDLPNVKYGSGNGAGQFHSYTSPIYIPYYHPKQTYRAQARKAKSRKANK
jgi:hypothetical protein